MRETPGISCSQCQTLTVTDCGCLFQRQSPVYITVAESPNEHKQKPIFSTLMVEYKFQRLDEQNLCYFPVFLALLVNFCFVLHAC